jgi:hypothetical protein
VEVILGSNFSSWKMDSSVSVSDSIPKARIFSGRNSNHEIIFPYFVCGFSVSPEELSHSPPCLCYNPEPHQMHGSPLQAGLIKGKPMTEDVPVETFTGLCTESEMNNIKYQSNVLMHIFRDLSL